MSHIGAYNSAWQESTIPQINSVLPQPGAKMPALPWVIDDAGGCANVNDDPVNLALGALLVRMEENRTNGRPLPPSPLPETVTLVSGAPMWAKNGAGNEFTDKKVAALKLDAFGNTAGGVRMPWVTVPAATYPQPVPIPPPPPEDAGNAHASRVMPGLPRVPPSDGWPRASAAESKLPHRPGGNFCPIFHPRIPLDAATLRKAYGSYAAYAAKFDAAKADAVAKGWLLKEDAATLRPRASPADFK